MMPEPSFPPPKERDNDSDFTNAVLGLKWYAVLNDCIGGWTITTHDSPVGEIFDQHPEAFMVADMIYTEALAKYIAATHNEQLRRLQESSEYVSIVSEDATQVLNVEVTAQAIQPEQTQESK